MLMRDDFFSKSFYLINDPEMFRLFDIESVNWKEKGDVGLQIIERDFEIENNIISTQKILGEKYVHKIDPKYKFSEQNEIVNGMDDATLSWHNDLCEGPNLQILLYFDTMDEDTGGSISFKELKTKKEYCFFPQKYDVLIMNHSMRFQHIVSPLKLPIFRRVASFNYHIDDKLTQ